MKELQSQTYYELAKPKAVFFNYEGAKRNQIKTVE